MVNWDRLIPWIEETEITRHASEFLIKYNREGVLPLPIEQIAEFKLNINIVTLPGLQDRIGTVGFITSDLTEIDVDLEVSEKYPSRFRWTITHEIGHLILHRALYETQNFTSPEAWKEWVGSIPDRPYRRLESQANMVASKLLIPPADLAEQFEEMVEKLKAGGFDWTTAPEMLYKRLSARFGVSPKSIMFALVNEGLVGDPRSNF